MLFVRTAAADATDAGRDVPPALPESAASSDAPPVSAPEPHSAASEPARPSGAVPSVPAATLSPPETVSSSIEVQVVATSRDRSAQLRDSSAAVLVVDTKAAQAEASDLGALLTRQQGVNVQRAGGLGSQTRISLQGLGEDQIRFYVDGVPLAFTGLPESIAFVPIDLLARVEMYRGVVPIQLGGDTLGGAIQLISHEPQAGAHGSASLTLGSFDTERGVLRAQLLDPKRGLYASATGFLDHARNDYGMDDVPVAQPNGRREPRRVYRMHDDYRGGYSQLELGLIDRPYAKRLVLRPFLSGFDKEINHDPLMYNAYGEVLSRRRSQGATLFYDHDFRRKLSLTSKLGYAHRTRQLRDLSQCAYDWYLNCVDELDNGGGEINGVASNRKTDEHDLFLRLTLALRVSRLLQLRVSLAPTYAQSSSQDVATLPEIPDLFAQDRKLFGLNAGLEHELDAFAGRLENVLFVKSYLQLLSADAMATQGTVNIERQHRRFGVGDAVRFRLHDQLLGKLSYELGTRLPDSNELFGDGAFVEANLELRPEASHNVNVELRWAYETPRLGAASLSATAFFRHVEDFIFLLPGPTLTQYQNLITAQVKGVEGSAHYVTPGEYLTLDGNATWQDMRNLSDTGTYGMFEGERVPNRPYLFANLSATGKLQQLVSEHDALSLTFRESFVGEFFRAFEMANTLGSQAVPSQLVSSLILTYDVTHTERAISASIEANNLTDAMVYDFFGVKKPGRFALAKLTYRM